jgi:NAD(P)-dependent dehydrogenase (short-subunit alcohol dehydrogenase family)
MDLGLDGKRAIVTGGSRGIGFATAATLAAEGADVVLVARDQAGLDEAAGRLEGHGRRILAVAADTRDDEAVRAMVARVAGEFGGVDVLVNAAALPGRPGAVPTLERPDDDLRFEIETKVLGYLRCARAVAPHMVDQGWGRIVNVSGLAARQSGNAFGSIRNAAVVALTKNLADELGPAGVNVTAVHPGNTVTERTPELAAELARTRGIGTAEAMAAMATGVGIGRLVTAAEVADVIAFLASPRGVAVNGDVVAVGGGARGPIVY